MHVRVLRLAAMSLCVLVALQMSGVSASVSTESGGSGRDSWYPSEPFLGPSAVSSPAFGQVFDANVTGAVYAQPLVWADSVLVATESNTVTALNKTSGESRWSVSLGEPYHPPCDALPDVGVTGTPVIDPATGTAYLFSKNAAGEYWVHALAVADGSERSGFPVMVQGQAANDPSHVFDSATALQRTGLLLLDGVVYAGFASHCDLGNYEGWIVGVSTKGEITTFWTDEAGQSERPAGGGIWQSGIGLLSDRPDEIVVAVGNGIVAPEPGAGADPPQALAEAVVRLAVQPDGSLQPIDFFSPFDAADLSDRDLDLGSGGVVALPRPAFGTANVPNLLLTGGKEGRLYLLDGDRLGGRGQADGGGDAIPGSFGPFGGIYGVPTAWPGDGGWVYLTTAPGESDGSDGTGELLAFHYAVAPDGQPTLQLEGRVGGVPFGFGSGSPVVTSTGVADGSALVWVVWLPDQFGDGAELRAYDALPVAGKLQLRFAAPLGQASKFSVPTVDRGVVFVGTRDGHLLAFGSPGAAADSARATLPGLATDDGPIAR